MAAVLATCVVGLAFVIICMVRIHVLHVEDIDCADIVAEKVGQNRDIL